MTTNKLKEQILSAIKDLCPDKLAQGSRDYVEFLIDQYTSKIELETRKQDIETLDRWKDDITNCFTPKCSFCHTKRKVVGQITKGKEAMDNNNLPRNWGYYCQKCYDEGMELEREAMYGNKRLEEHQGRIL